jgi:hypothetical protein
MLGDLGGGTNQGVAALHPPEGGRRFEFSSRTNSAGLETYSALRGRVQFLLKENPGHEVLHTVQVERNGFIHAMVAGTEAEGEGYEYFGPRAYTRWIVDE